MKQNLAGPWRREGDLIVVFQCLNLEERWGETLDEGLEGQDTGNGIILHVPVSVEHHRSTSYMGTLG